MDALQVIILALIQGFSEFLPISSSAHLILIPELFNWHYKGLAFDVVVHMGTLVAVVYYYKQDIVVICKDFCNSIVSKKSIGESRLAWAVVIATIPVGLVGLFFKDFIINGLRSTEIIAYATIVFGLLLGFASWFNLRYDKLRSIINYSDAVMIGVMQALALVPGVSRSGIVLTMCLMLGINFKSSARFTFLLAIPVILLSLLLMSIDLYYQPELVNLNLLLGFAVAGVSAYFTIVFFIKMIDKMGILPFVVYRLFLGVFLLLL